MSTYQIYIGSNNATKELELDKIEDICSEHHEGFTIQPATGYWMGQREHTAVVTITDNQSKIDATIQELKNKLHQEAIAFQKVPMMHFIWEGYMRSRTTRVGRLALAYVILLILAYFVK